MGWKGTLRAIQSAQRQAEREAKRQQRILERRKKEIAKMQELEKAAYEVDVYENKIAVLSSVHKERGNIWQWDNILSQDPPTKPTKSTKHEDAARANLKSYKPTALHRVFGLSNKKQTKLEDELKSAIEEDEQEYLAALDTYEKELEDWKTTQELSKKILSGDEAAYLEVIEQTNPLGELEEFISSPHIKVYNSYVIDVSFKIHDIESVPADIKSLRQNGKLSTKKMPKGKRFELYQDLVCGCAIRAARELLALLPVRIVIVTVISDILNTSTGYMEEKPILSVAIPKDTLERLNFSALDPSDAMDNFSHQMKFRKTIGFQAVTRLDPAEF